MSHPRSRSRTNDEPAQPDGVTVAEMDDATGLWIRSFKMSSLVTSGWVADMTPANEGCHL